MPSSVLEILLTHTIHLFHVPLQQWCHWEPCCDWRVQGQAVLSPVDHSQKQNTMIPTVQVANPI